VFQFFNTHQHVELMGSLRTEAFLVRHAHKFANFWCAPAEQGLRFVPAGASNALQNAWTQYKHIIRSAGAGITKLGRLRIVVFLCVFHAHHTVSLRTYGPAIRLCLLECCYWAIIRFY
jgi:hypothetical protein